MRLVSSRAGLKREKEQERQVKWGEKRRGESSLTHRSTHRLELLKMSSIDSYQTP